MVDLADRMNGGRPTIITDGFGPYLDAVDAAFGVDVDFAQLVRRACLHRPRSFQGFVMRGTPTARRSMALDYDQPAR